MLRIIDLTLGGGDQTFGPGLFSVRHDGSELRELIAPRRPFVGGRRIDREPLDWRHALLAVPAAGNEVIVGRCVLDRNDEVEKIIPLRPDVTTLRTRPIVDKAPDGAKQWLFDARGEPLLTIATKEGRTKVHRSEPGGARWQQVADARLPGRVNRLSCRRCESDDMVVLVRSWSDQGPGPVWVYRHARDSWYDVGRVRSAIDPRRMGTLDLHRIQARDGLDLPVWVTMPAAAARGTANAMPAPAGANGAGPCRTTWRTRCSGRCPGAWSTAGVCASPVPATAATRR